MKNMLLLLFAALSFNSCYRANKQNLDAQVALSLAQMQQKSDELRQQRLELARPGKPSIIGNLNAAEGTTLSTDDLKGKVVVMDFWASWCTPCIERIPHLYETAKKYDPKKAAFLLVNVDAEKAHWQKIVQDKQWTKDSYWIGDEAASNPLFGYALSEMAVEGDSAAILLTLPKHVLIDMAGNTAYNYIPGKEQWGLDSLVAGLILGKQTPN